MRLAENNSAGLAGVPEWEATLRQLAHAPVPAGLEERVHAALNDAPRRARVLAWTAAGWWAGALRFAAAAAIVLVVAGGGWSVYHRAQLEAAKSLVAPAPAAAPQASGFATAGAKRVPQTVVGPAAAQTPVKKQAKKPHAATPAGAK
jgi:hypothetical protein